MKWHRAVLSSFGIFLSCILTTPFTFAADESCNCAPSRCGVCEVETGTTFYSAKCGPQNSQVKSCKRATCEPVEEQKLCLARLKGGGSTEASTSAEVIPARQIANYAAEAGQILDLQGDFSVTHTNGVTEKPRKRDPAFVGDVFETKADGVVKVVLRDGSEVAMAPNSKLRIEKVDVEASSLKRQVAMMVLAGKVRNKVTKNYKGENSYVVRTPSAVAGVRGTDFITIYRASESGWVSEVRTFEGLVRLSSADKLPKSGVSFVDIPGGTYAHLIHSDSAGAPELSPLYKLKEDEMRELQARDFASTGEPVAKRAIASVGVDESVCSAPVAGYNQCSYTCENNPGGEKRCRTDLPDVACVRRICRANGQWAEQKRLPASESGRCEPKGSVVDTCGGYW